MREWIGCGLAIGLVQCVFAQWLWKRLVKRDEARARRHWVPVTYRYEPRATGTEGVPRYEAGTDVAATFQTSAHTQCGRS